MGSRTCARRCLWLVAKEHLVKRNNESKRCFVSAIGIRAFRGHVLFGGALGPCLSPSPGAHNGGVRDHLWAVAPYNQSQCKNQQKGVISGGVQFGRCSFRGQCPCMRYQPSRLIWCFHRRACWENGGFT